MLAFADDAPRQLCLEPEQRIAVAQKLTALETENASLRESVRAAPTPALVVVLVVAALVAGGVTGAVVARAAR